MPTARTFDGKQYHLEKSVVAVSSNSGSLAVVFDTAYEIAPQVTVIAPRGSAGTYAAGSVTKSGFTINITSETDTDFDDGNVTVYWFAMET